MNASPFPIILSSPSGAGKTTIARRILADRADLGYSVSCTTRQSRAGEVDGRDYYFLDRAEFQRRIDEGAFAEHANVHGNLYGTLVTEVQRVLGGGRHVVLDVDVQGAAQLRKAFPEVVTIFVLPPSGDVLIGRLESRKTESRQTIVRRLTSALSELREVEGYQYVVVNDSLEDAVRRVSAIIDAEAVKRERMPGLADGVAALVQRVQDEIRTFSE